MTRRINLSTYAMPLPYRMTYEKAGQLYNKSKNHKTSIADDDFFRNGLKKPTGTFFEFIEDNKYKLQLFDETPIAQFKYLGTPVHHVCIYIEDIS